MGSTIKKETIRAKGVEITVKQGVYSEKPILEQIKGKEE